MKNEFIQIKSKLFALRQLFDISGEKTLENLVWSAIKDIEAIELGVK